MRGATAGMGGGAPSPLDDVRREIAILKKLSHPNIVQLVEVMDDTRVDRCVGLLPFFCVCG